MYTHKCFRELGRKGRWGGDDWKKREAIEEGNRSETRKKFYYGQKGIKSKQQK